MSVEFPCKEVGTNQKQIKNRIQMVYRNYTYLRDKLNKNWMSLKVQQVEHISLRPQLTRQANKEKSVKDKDKDKEKDKSGLYSCSHCKSGLYGGGRGSCLWKDKTGAKAK